MNVKLYIYTILILVGGIIHSGSLKAQGEAASNKITGVVLDRNNRPIADVLVSIQENRGEVVTNKDGKFEIFCAKQILCICETLQRLRHLRKHLARGEAKPRHQVGNHEQ